MAARPEPEEAAQPEEGGRVAAQPEPVREEDQKSSEDDEDQFADAWNAEDYEEYEERRRIARVEAMADEGVADWTLQRQVLQYKFRRQQRIQNRDVGFLMRVRSRMPDDFDTEEELVAYLKAKLMDLACNGR